MERHGITFAFRRLDQLTFKRGPRILHAGKPMKTKQTRRVFDFQVKHRGVWKSVAKDADLDWLQDFAKRHFSRHQKQRFATIYEKEQAP